jgi:hypothetical protein
MGVVSGSSTFGHRANTALLPLTYTAGALLALVVGERGDDEECDAKGRWEGRSTLHMLEGWVILTGCHSTELASGCTPVMTGGEAASGSGKMARKESSDVSSRVAKSTKGALEARNMEQPALAW